MHYLLFFLCLITLPSCAQSFEGADALYEEGAYRKAAEAYAALLSTGGGDEYQYYRAGSAWALAGDTARALVYLQEAAASGYHHAEELRRDENLNPLHQTAAWSGIVAGVEGNLAEFEKDYDHGLQDRLERIRPDLRPLHAHDVHVAPLGHHSGLCLCHVGHRVGL